MQRVCRIRSYIVAIIVLVMLSGIALFSVSFAAWTGNSSVYAEAIAAVGDYYVDYQQFQSAPPKLTDNTYYLQVPHQGHESKSDYYAFSTNGANEVMLQNVYLYQGAVVTLFNGTSTSTIIAYKDASTSNITRKELTGEFTAKIAGYYSFYYNHNNGDTSNKGMYIKYADSPAAVTYADKTYSMPFTVKINDTGEQRTMYFKTKDGQSTTKEPDKYYSNVNNASLYIWKERNAVKTNHFYAGSDTNPTPKLIEKHKGDALVIESVDELQYYKIIFAFYEGWNEKGNDSGLLLQDYAKSRYNYITLHGQWGYKPEEPIGTSDTVTAASTFVQAVAALSNAPTTFAPSANVINPTVTVRQVTSAATSTGTPYTYRNQVSVSRRVGTTPTATLAYVNFYIDSDSTATISKFSVKRALTKDDGTPRACYVDMKVYNDPAKTPDSVTLNDDRLQPTDDSVVKDNKDNPYVILDFGASTDQYYAMEVEIQTSAAAEFTLTAVAKNTDAHKYEVGNAIYLGYKSTVTNDDFGMREPVYIGTTSDSDIVKDNIYSFSIETTLRDGDSFKPFETPATASDVKKNGKYFGLGTNNGHYKGYLEKYFKVYDASGDEQPFSTYFTLPEAEFGDNSNITVNEGKAGKYRLTYYACAEQIMDPKATAIDYRFFQAVDKEPILTVTCLDPMTEKNTAIVTFNANGGAFEGGAATLAVPVKTGSTVAKHQNPKENGYIFKGWYKEPDCTNAWDFATSKVTGDTSLYAGYVAEQRFAITVNAGGGNWSGSTDAKTIYTAENGKITVGEGSSLSGYDGATGAGTMNIYKPTYDGYTFRGWYLSDKPTAGDDSQKVTATANNIFTELTPIYAVFDKNPEQSVFYQIDGVNNDYKYQMTHNEFPSDNSIYEWMAEGVSIEANKTIKFFIGTGADEKQITLTGFDAQNAINDGAYLVSVGNAKEIYSLAAGIYDLYLGNLKTSPNAWKLFVEVKKDTTETIQYFKNAGKVLTNEYIAKLVVNGVEAANRYGYYNMSLSGGEYQIPNIEIDSTKDLYVVGGVTLDTFNAVKYNDTTKTTINNFVTVEQLTDGGDTTKVYSKITLKKNGDNNGDNNVYYGLYIKADGKLHVTYKNYSDFNSDTEVRPETSALFVNTKDGVVKFAVNLGTDDAKLPINDVKLKLWKATDTGTTQVVTAGTALCGATVDGTAVTGKLDVSVDTEPTYVDITRAEINRATILYGTKEYTINSAELGVVNATIDTNGYLTYTLSVDKNNYEYTVTANANNGKFSDSKTTKEISDIGYKSGIGDVKWATITGDNAPTRTGYTFAGWYAQTDLNSDGTVIAGKTAYTATTAITADTTLYAGWTINTYTVTFDLNGMKGTAPESKSVEHGKTLDAVTFEVPNHYNLKGWFDDKGTRYDGTSEKPIEDEITLYAQWYCDNGLYADGEYVAALTDNNSYPEKQLVRFTTGYVPLMKDQKLTFWYNNNGQLPEPCKIADGTMYVRTDVSSMSGSGKITGTAGSDITVQQTGWYTIAYANKDWDSDRTGLWIEYKGGYSATPLAVGDGIYNDTATLGAFGIKKTEPNKVTADVVLSEHMSVSVKYGGVNITQYALATGSLGVIVDGKLKLNKGTYNIEYADGDKSLYVTGTPEYHVTISKLSENGTVTVNDAQSCYVVANGQVTVKVTDITLGYQIESVKWNDGTDHQLTASADGVFTFNASAHDITVIVSFSQIDYAITTQVGDVKGGTIAVTVGGSSRNTAHYNDEIVVTITTNDGYSFESLKVDGVVVSTTNNTYSFNITANTNIVVNFNANTYAVTCTVKDVNGTISDIGEITMKCTSPVAYKTVVTVTATIKAAYKENYRIKEFTASANVTDLAFDKATGNYSFTMPIGDVTLTAIVETIVKTAVRFVPPSWDKVDPNSIKINYFDSGVAVDYNYDNAKPISAVNGVFSYQVPIGTKNIVVFFKQDVVRWYSQAIPVTLAEDTTYVINNVNFHKDGLYGTKEFTADITSLAKSEITVSAEKGGVTFTAPTVGADGKYIAEEGSIVTFTVAVGDEYSADYNIGDVTYTVQNETPRTITPKDGVYSFQMPNKAVTINCNFVKKQHSISSEVMVDGAVSSVGEITINDDLKAAESSKQITGKVASKNPAYGVIDVRLTYTNGVVLTGLTYNSETQTFSFEMPVGAVKIIATFKLIEFSVGVTNVDGGTVFADPTKATAGTTITLTVTPNTGYRIASWTYGSTTTTVDGTVTSATGYTFEMPASNVTVSAEFTKIDYAITTDTPTNGTVVVKSGATKVSTANNGDTITLTVTPNTGYRIASWTYGSTTTPVDGAVTSATNYTFTMPASDVNVSATFEIVTYEITYHVVANGTAPTTYTKYNVETPTFKLPDPTGIKEGWTFVGWYDCNDTAVTQITTGTVGDKSFWAKIVEGTKYSITASNNITGGSVEVKDGLTQAVAGATITLTVTPNTGYRIASWTYGSTTTPVDGAVTSATNYTFTMPASDVNVSATFEKIDYAIKTGTTNNGTVVVKKGDTEVLIANYGDEIAITNTSDKGYELDKITVKKSDGTTEVTVTAGKFTMPADSVTVTVTFKPIEYTIQYIVDGTEDNATTNPKKYKITDNAVTLSNPSKDGHTFAGWYIGENCTGTKYNAIDSSNFDDLFSGVYSNTTVKLYGKFTKNIYSVKYYENKPSGVNGSITDMPNDNIGVEYGTSLSKPTDPKLSGYKFIGWATTAVGDVINFPTTVNNNIDLYAKWQAVYELYNGDVSVGEFVANAEKPTEEVMISNVDLSIASTLSIRYGDKMIALTKKGTCPYYNLNSNNQTFTLPPSRYNFYLTISGNELWVSIPTTIDTKNSALLMFSDAVVVVKNGLTWDDIRDRRLHIFKTTGGDLDGGWSTRWWLNGGVYQVAAKLSETTIMFTFVQNTGEKQTNNIICSDALKGNVVSLTSGSNWSGNSFDGGITTSAILYNVSA